VDAIDSATVVFRLKRPQPALLLMLASGYTPIYAAHLSPASYRTGCIGTGPFKLKEWRKGEFVEYARNPHYFVKGRPHLDSLQYVIIAERAMATGALELARVDAAFPGETTKPTGDRLRRTVPKLVVTEVNSSVFDSLIVNTRKAPFNHAGVREALSRAIDRRALINAVYQGGAALGATMGPRTAGAWGLVESDLRTLPGYGRPADEKAKARTLLSAAGFGPGKPLKVELLTRALPAFADVAAFVVNEMRSVGVEASLRQVDTAQWYPLLTRGDFELGIDRTGIADDPDANFYENFTCGSPRNYSGYCDDKIAALIDQQSQELDPARRIALVHTVQKKLEETAARPVLCWRLDYFAVWPYVKNLVPHQSIYSWGRMQEVWLDK
jgi:peptide/nickel transport system substrate-binding protein